MTPPDGLGYCECERCLKVCDGGEPCEAHKSVFARRPDGVLINVARGRIVDEDALFAALKEGRIGGAILDVWYNYPQNKLERIAI